MFSRTKLFMVLYFLPSWIASLLQWGDDRTSSGFAAAPPLFYRVQLVVQFAAILLLFTPPRLRPRPSLPILFLSVVTIVGLSIAAPILEAEFILINASMLIAGIAIFLAIAEPGATFRQSDIAFLFYLFTAGFALQIFLFLQLGIVPSHSITDLFVRFNGITNDSLASGFVITMFIPWAATTRYSLLKVVVIVGEAFASGSLFAVVFVPLAAIGYLLYQRLYRLALTLVAIMLAAAIYFYDLLVRILDIKLLSIVTHLRFILNLSGNSYQQSKASCSEEFCESFLESATYLSPVYLLGFYALMLCFIVPIFRPDRFGTASSLMTNTLRFYGAALIVGTLVHPVPLIPFAMPMFLILASLYLGERAADRRAALFTPVQPISA